MLPPTRDWREGGVAQSEPIPDWWIQTKRDLKLAAFDGEQQHFL